VAEEDRFARVCDVPAGFRRRSQSLLDVVRASGYAELRGQFAARELADYLRARPALIDHWVAYSEDKRTSEGWYLRPPYSVGRITLEPPPTREQHYFDLATACAAFIIGELNDILDGAPAAEERPPVGKGPSSGEPGDSK
jgi:hypothetical protein